eukprot:4933955-Prorocentrum_lima.AAC.1
MAAKGWSANFPNLIAPILAWDGLFGNWRCRGEISMGSSAMVFSGPAHDGASRSFRASPLT